MNQLCYRKRGNWLQWGATGLGVRVRRRPHPVQIRDTHQQNHEASTSAVLCSLKLGPFGCDYVALGVP